MKLTGPKRRYGSWTIFLLARDAHPEFDASLSFDGCVPLMRGFWPSLGPFLLPKSFHESNLRFQFRFFDEGSDEKSGRTMFLRAASVAFVIFLTIIPESLAKSGGNHFVGLTGGLAFPTASSSIFSWGLNSFIRISGNLGLGAFFQRYGIDAEIASEVGSASLRASTVYYGIEPQYAFTRSLDGFIGGLRLGMASSSKGAVASDTTGGNVEISDSVSQFFIAPKLCYDYPLGRFSVGLEGSYALSFGTGAPSAALIQLVGKFWF